MENALSYGLALGLALLPVIALARWAVLPARVPVPVRARKTVRR